MEPAPRRTLPPLARGLHLAGAALPGLTMGPRPPRGGAPTRPRSPARPGAPAAAGNTGARPRGDSRGRLRHPTVARDTPAREPAARARLAAPQPAAGSPQQPRGSAESAREAAAEVAECAPPLAPAAAAAAAAPLRQPRSVPSAAAARRCPRPSGSRDRLPGLGSGCASPPGGGRRCTRRPESRGRRSRISLCGRRLRPSPTVPAPRAVAHSLVGADQGASGRSDSQRNEESGVGVMSA